MRAIPKTAGAAARRAKFRARTRATARTQSTSSGAARGTEAPGGRAAGSADGFVGSRSDKAPRAACERPGCRSRPRDRNMHSRITPRRLNEAAPSSPTCGGALAGGVFCRRISSRFPLGCGRYRRARERAIWASAHPPRSAQDDASRISLTFPGNRTIPDIESRRRVQRPAAGSVTPRARPMGPTPALRGGGGRGVACASCRQREADHPYDKINICASGTRRTT